MDKLISKEKSLTTKLATVELIVEGAGCASCVGKIETALSELKGVKNAEMNFALRTVTVTLIDKEHVDLTKLIQAIESIGYNAKNAQDRTVEELCDEKEIAEQKYYQKLMLQMRVRQWLSLH